MSENQYITCIKAREEYKNIKVGFEWDNIPKFAVITGENGSGKSALLEMIKDKKCTSQDLKAEIKFFNEFKLQNCEYQPNFAQQVKSCEDFLLQKHRSETDLGNKQSIFNQTNQNSRPYPTIYPNLKDHAITFQEFIKQDFAKYDDGEQVYLKNWRANLNLDTYQKHFKRNGMSEEKFYLSSYDEIKEWLQNLQDKNFESKNVIFDEEALLSIFGSYFTQATNLRNELFTTIRKIPQINNEIKKRLGEDPLVSINQLLKQAYSKYFLHMEIDAQFKPKLVCKNNDQISVPLKCLSTGEQIIISLFMWQYKNVNLDSIIFLLDEPDAHLNPKMSKILIDTLKNVIVKNFKCQVIMTTHSLATVAQCEDKDLFYMEDGKIESTSREMSMERLSGGILIEEIRNITELLIESKKILLVEGISDKIHIEKYFEKIGQKPPFRIFNCRSATKMEHYAKMIIALKPKMQNRCLFLCDDDSQGIKAHNRVSQYNLKTMFVSEVQNRQNQNNFTIENLYDKATINKIIKTPLSNWSLEDKVNFANQEKDDSELKNIGILINMIKTKLQI